MKFTQNEAAKKISSILTRGGKTCYLSERSINEQLDALMKLLVTDDTELDDFIGKVEPMFKTLNGNVQNEQSQFVNKWNEEHKNNPEPPKPTDPPTDPKPGDNAEVAELKKMVQQLIDKQTADDKQKVLREKKNELIAKLKEKGVKDDAWISDFTSEISISEDFDVETKADTYLKLYNKSVANVPPTPTPGSPSGSVDDNDTLKAASEMAKRKREVEENRFK